uniref:Reticulon-like protein n=1 Tax=Anthurium amnicola TaxID=1678845 RepID=A0A1D1ZD13_9ARAE
MSSMEVDSTNNDNIVKENIEESQPKTIEPTIIEQQPIIMESKDTQKELIEETATTVLEKLKEATATSSPEKIEPEEKKRQIKDLFENLSTRAIQLVYWENPTHSGSLLGISLLFLIYTAYYSLFNTFCALATILIGANWIYVMGRKQLQSLINQKPVNPHEHLLVNKPWYIERKDVENYLDATIEAVNFILLKAQKIVLVDDPMGTIRYVLMFYVLWTLGTWISLRTLFGIGLILSFATPIAYQKNQTLVDEKLYQSNKFLRSYLDRGLVMAKQHTGGVYEKAKSFAVTKGLVNDDKGATQNTKKEE